MADQMKESTVSLEMADDGITHLKVERTVVHGVGIASLYDETGKTIDGMYGIAFYDSDGNNIVRYTMTKNALMEIAGLTAAEALKHIQGGDSENNP